MNSYRYTWDDTEFAHKAVFVAAWRHIVTTFRAVDPGIA